MTTTYMTSFQRYIGTTARFRQYSSYIGMVLGGWFKYTHDSEYRALLPSGVSKKSKYLLNVNTVLVGSLFGFGVGRLFEASLLSAALAGASYVSVNADLKTIAD